MGRREGSRSAPRPVGCRRLGALAGLVVLGAGLATWALVASSPPARQTRQTPATTAEVTLAVSCRGCVPCGPDGNCPECDHKLAAAAGGVPGVVSASFAEHRSCGLGQGGQTVVVNVPVGTIRTLTLEAPHPGTYVYHCGSDMYFAKIVAS